MFKTTLLAVACAAFLPVAALAESQIGVHDAYVRSSSPTAKTGAAFLMLHNHGDTDDRLIAARSPAAERVELHTHIADANGVMRMREIEGGIPLPADGEHLLERGGDHLMFLGLTAPLVQGEMIPVTLVFEQAGDVPIEVMVDLERQPAAHGGGMDHDMGHDMGKDGEMGHDMGHGMDHDGDMPEPAS